MNSLHIPYLLSSPLVLSLKCGIMYSNQNALGEKFYCNNIYLETTGRQGIIKSTENERILKSSVGMGGRGWDFLRRNAIKWIKTRFKHINLT